MSQPPSHTGLPGDDFVLWPEGAGAGKVGETKLQRALNELAPPVTDSEGDEAAAPGGPGGDEALEGQDERFYPASRHWFRTTAAIPAADAADKWWREAESPAVPPEATGITVDPPQPESHADAQPDSPGLLSPEEIWELAAEELEHSGRLRARFEDEGKRDSLVQDLKPDEPVAPTEPAVSGGAEAAESPAGPAVPAVPVVPVVPIVPVVPAPSLISSPVARPSAAPASEPDPVISFPVARPSPVETVPPVAAASPVLSAQRTELPQERRAHRKPVTRHEAAPASAALDPSTAAPPLVRPPIARRKGGSTPPQPRAFPPSAKAAVPPVTMAPSAEVDPVSDSSTPAERRSAPDHRQSSRATRPGRKWGRRLAATLGLFVVLGGVAAVIGRDFIPTDWGAATRQWWRSLDQLVFPHQYRHPQRGVQQRTDATSEAGEAGDTGETGQGAVPTAAGGLNAADSPSPGLSEAPSAGIMESPQLDRTVPAAENDAPAPGAAAEPQAPAADPENVLVPPMPAFVPRAEPVYDDEEIPPAPPGSEEPPAASESADPPIGTNGTPEAHIAPNDILIQEAAVDASQPDTAAAPTAPADSDLRDGEAAVRRLIAARSVAEVLPLIFDASTLESAVRSYHARTPLVPLLDAVIEHDYSGIIPSTGGRTHIFNVLHTSHPRGFPVSAESTPDGFRIDWQSYIQWRDDWLKKFIAAKPADPQSLFVVLKRTHYFNDDVPDLENKLAFKLTSAIPDDEGTFAFVDKNSAVGRSLAENFEWRRIYFPVVELQWVDPGQSGEYVRLNRIVRPTWRRVGE